MVIAPLGKNKGNVSFPMFPRISPASDQWWGNLHRARVFFCNNIVTGLRWIYDYRSVDLLTGSSTFEQSTSLYRVVTLDSKLSNGFCPVTHSIKTPFFG